MTIKTALRGTMGFGAACLLAGSAAWAEGAMSTGPTTPPSSSDYRLRDPVPERFPAPNTAAPGAAPDSADGSLAPRDHTGSLGTEAGDNQASSGTGSLDTDNDAAQASSGTGNLQDDDSAPVSVAGRVDKVDRADDTIEIDGVDRQLKLDSDTRVTRNGSQASFSDVQEGEQVRASFDDGFPAHLRQVEIMSPRSAAPDNAPSTTGTGAATSTGPAGSPSDMSDRAGTAPDSAAATHESTGSESTGNR